jgi:nucleoside-diphosphate-sugar epimerase
MQALAGEVRVRALLPPGWQAAGQEPDVELIEAPLEDPDALASAVTGADVVYVCTETTPDVRLSPLLPQPVLLRRVVEAARRAGAKRLVHVSTADVLGSNRRERISEVGPARPQNAYERTKLREEQYLRAQVDDLDWVIVRPARGVGTHDRLWSEHLIGELAPERRIWQAAGGRVYQTFIAGADLGRALLAAGRRGQPHHTYLVGGFDATWRELLDTASAALRIPVHVQPMPFDVAYLAAAARELTTGFGQSCWPNRYAVDAFGRPHLYDDSRSRRQLTWSPQVGSFSELLLSSPLIGEASHRRPNEQPDRSPS